MLVQYLSGVDLQLLSQTLQDAIFVARRLSIRYFWVDTLFIIQEG